MITITYHIPQSKYSRQSSQSIKVTKTDLPNWLAWLDYKHATYTINY